MKKVYMLILAVLMIGFSSQAQQTWNCTGAEFRVFDFWLGNWAMQDRASGTPLGKAVVQKIHDGCAIREDWQANGGGSGANIVTYNPPSKAWRMISITSGGGHLLSFGTWDNSSLSFLTDVHSPTEKPQRRRITWTKTQDPNKVLQTWEVSENNGKSWYTEFDGLCLRLP